MLYHYDIVIPCYQNFEYILDAINSVQQDQVGKIIVINDSGNDECTLKLRDLLKSVQERCPKILLIHNRKNRGVTYCRNLGFRKSKADFVVFLDSDDTLLPNGIKIINERISKISDAASVFFFRTETGGLINGQAVENKLAPSSGLFKAASAGERLVVVKAGNKNKGLPFIGALRGHELAGLYRYMLRNDLWGLWADDIVREYRISDDGLSSKRFSKERARLLAFGHFKICVWTFREKLYSISARYIAKSATYRLVALFSVTETDVPPSELRPRNRTV